MATRRNHATHDMGFACDTPHDSIRSAPLGPPRTTHYGKCAHGNGRFVLMLAVNFRGPPSHPLNAASAPGPIEEGRRTLATARPRLLRPS